MFETPAGAGSQDRAGLVIEKAVAEMMQLRNDIAAFMAAYERGAAAFDSFCGSADHALRRQQLLRIASASTELPSVWMADATENRNSR